MLLALFLFLQPIFKEDDLVMNLDYNYSAIGDTLLINIHYKIPYNSLIFSFHKEKKEFVAQYSLALKAEGNRDKGIIYQSYLDSINLFTYQETKSNKEKEKEILLRIIDFDQYEKINIFASVRDLNSERHGEYLIEIKPKLPHIHYRSNVNAHSQLELKDTINFSLSYFKIEPESIVFSILRDKEIIERRVYHEPISDKILPVVDIPQVQKKSAHYQLKFEIMGRDKKVYSKSFPFMVVLPFFLSDQDYENKVSELIYIASEKEMRELKKVKKEEREKKWQEFWQKKDIPEKEYFQKVEYCKKNFARGDKGLFSDRAKIYFRYGEPDYVETFPYEIDKKPYIKWHYHQLGKEFIFVDYKGFGEYVLAYPKEELWK